MMLTYVSLSGFGANTQNQGTSLFGSQPRPSSGFGAGNSTGGGIFGGGTSTAAPAFGGGFGSPGTASGFGTTNTTGTGFGAKPAATGFSGNTTGTGAGFGTGGSGFAAGASGFGGGTGTAFQQAVPPSDGTGSTPYSAFTERDTSSSVMNHYQSVSFMQPYSKYSFEELRLGDYNQGRRFGNGSGQAGAFGSSAFGGGTPAFGTQQQPAGFGSTSSPFGGTTTNAPSTFGQTQTAGGLGSTPSNPLFGASKPAASLFGGGASSGASQPNLFGTANTSGFGAPNNTTGTFGGSGGSVFGNSNQQQPNKPLFGTGAGTGTGTTGTAGFGGFGAQNTTSSTPFGGTASTPFGGQQQPQPQQQQQQTGTGGFGGFGQNQAQNQTQNKGLFGGFGGNTQQSSTPAGGLFGGGAANTGSSLFGQNNQQNQQQPGNSLFGGSAQPTGAGSLFGGNQQQGQKSLFGTGQATGTGTGTGGFGGFANTQNQQPGTSLFGGAQNQQQQKPNLFGGNTGSSLFGGSAPTQNTGSSLFGNTQNQQQQPGGLGTSSLFGGTQQQQPQQMQQSQPAPGSLQASLLDGNPYGNQSIFSGLPAPNTPSPGPLATPLSSTNKQKQRAPLPVYRITPSAANRLVTPPKPRGYGFSYSTYGSPSSAASTPNGLGGNLLGGSLRGSMNGSFGRSTFSKSFSASNLRKSFDPETDSVLSPGALSSGSSRLSSSNLKRLTIDRTLRNDLFTRPVSTPAAAITNGDDAAQSASKVKKKVSFESTADNTTGGEIVPVETQSPEPTSEELGFLRSIRKTGPTNGITGDSLTFADSSSPEMESVRTRVLTAVPEDRESASSASPAEGGSPLPFSPGGDPQPGNYWMKPARAELGKLSREELRRFSGLTVGRERCGAVTFDESVDLTTIDLDQIFGGLVEIGVRKITVYPDESIKPARGKGLNVPSTLCIENSWPRPQGKKGPSSLTNGPLFDKHIDRLRKVNNTEFVRYDTQTGTWVFRVAHYTTYGLDYDDEDEEGESLNQSTLSAAPDTPTQKARFPADRDLTAGSEQMSTYSIDDSFASSVGGVDDDTFDFKKRKMVPGAFGNQAMETVDEQELGSEDDEDESFLEEGSTGSTERYDDDVTESQQSGESEIELDEGEEMDMAGTFPDLDRTVEHDEGINSEFTQPSLKPWNTPPKARLDLTGDWAEQLQRTISPRKQNRDALRQIQANAFHDRPLGDGTPTKPAATTNAQQKSFATSIDLMNSLFQQPRKQQGQSPLKPQNNVQRKGFEPPQWPYNKQPKTFAGESNEMGKDDLDFHHSFKPRWGPVNSLLCARNELSKNQDGGLDWREKFSITSEGRDIALFASSRPAGPHEMLEIHRRQSRINRIDGLPSARLAQVNFEQFTKASQSVQSDQERVIWQLANILFNNDIEDDISAGVPPQLRPKYLHRIKKDRLSRLWEGIVRERNAHAVGKAGSPEERAIYLLCSHRVEEACNILMTSQNFHLATLISQIGRDATTRRDMAQQVEKWREQNVYSEMNEPIRALYELLAGNALCSEGKTGGALEDRASTFTFSERFELDWFQAFGLRLWYGISDDEPLEVAVSKFVEDLSSGQESAFPSPPHQDKGRGLWHTSTDTIGYESPLWVLLKAYSATLGADKSPVVTALTLPAALLPESVTGDKLSNRLPFQLCQVLAAALGRYERLTVNVAQMDQLVWDYAWELSACGNLTQTLFVLLHLSRASDRERALKEILARFAAQLPEPLTPEGSPSATWLQLTRDLQLSESWIWMSKALYARDIGDAAREVDCLVRGKNWNDAHATFSRIVGPTAVIEHDYATLETLLSGFGEAPERKVRGWASGGGVYEDFLRLATVRGRDPQRLNRLVEALVTMGETLGGSGVEGLEERVAFKEMSRIVAGWTALEDAKAIDLSRVLRLPLTGDGRLVQTAEMSRRYYSVIMAGGY
ncbi:nuclear protein 96-domain-containing protein [Aspergillus cavernicola]|uniref:Nuclear protein 96-domain-containing protein n=1 Tax=Aspergillus cavernicola TaxID=176166 RepID=A0ABR4HCR9_9EURO